MQLVNWLNKFYEENRFNTENGKCCCNESKKKDKPKNDKVSIPKTVSAVATIWRQHFVFEFIVEVSIPKTVSAVATHGLCPEIILLFVVSIPKTVSAVATNPQMKQ